jgi:hypothetical protein
MKQIIVLITVTFLSVWSSQCVNTHPDSKQKTATATTNPTPALVLPPGFSDYWYQGKAELSTYEVTQERYGELRKAEQVDVFVTEDFSRQKQVKLDDAGNAGQDRAPVLKMNTVRRFHTGIYDYSLMQSVFTPIDGSPSLKTTTTVQDWCGQVFTQFNATSDGYKVRSYSYFETEGDQEFNIGRAMAEDELWTRIRLNPAQIPTGAVSLIPAATYARLLHKPLRAEQATIRMETGSTESRLNVVYTQIGRTLTIRFETAFPFKILGWEETNQGALLSKGDRKTSLMSAYWGQHGEAFNNMRDSLQLRF